MKLIDTHCHLYLKDFGKDLDEVMRRARSTGVSAFYLPAIDSTTAEQMLNLELVYNGECFPMMGLHPCSVKGNYKAELIFVEGWLSRRKFSAIGEIGLDFYWDKSFINEQYIVFRQQMELALHYALPIVIHSRNATQETIDAVRPFAVRGLRGIFHCFGDNADTAKQITEIGFMLGIGGVVTYKKSGLAETLREIDLQHLVLETDAPYLTPVPFRGKRNEPAYLEHVINAIAASKEVSAETVAIVTTENAGRIFRV